MAKKVSEQETTQDNKPFKYSNTFRLSYTETDFNLDFGRVKAGEEQIKLIESITVPSTKIQDLILILLDGALKYEDTYDKDIGFKQVPRGNKVENGK